MPAEGRVLFILPTPTIGDSGPVATWIATAEWARAARRLYGEAWIVSPEGGFTAEEALGRASLSTLAPRRRGRWRRWVPEPAVTAYKDVRAWAAARRFRSQVLGGSWGRTEVLFVWNHHDLFHSAGMELARVLDRPLVQFVDALSVWESRRWGVRRPGWGSVAERVGERRQLLAADLVACVSDEVAGAVRTCGVSSDRILVTPNGVDLDLFSPAITGEEVRRRFGLEGKFVVGWVGSFRPFHGLPLVLEAIHRLQRSVDDIAVLLVGDGQERLRMQELAERLGIRDVVFTRTVPYQEVGRYIAAMDAALIVDEGRMDYHYSPLKLREYAASGKAVVAARAGEIERMLTDELDALLVEPGDAESLAAAIERLHQDADLRHALGQTARRKAEREWSWDRQLQEVDRALRMALQPLPGK